MSRPNTALTFALIAFAGACVRDAASQGSPPSAQIEPPGRPSESGAGPARWPGSQSCLVDGEPLESIPPPTDFCVAGSPNEDIAGALRLYLQERYVEAAAAFEREIHGGKDPEWPNWWQRARFYLAKTYRHLGRRREGEALLLAIVRSPDDPYRWAAAGQLCGGHPQRTPPAIAPTPSSRRRS